MKRWSYSKWSFPEWSETLERRMDVIKAISWVRDSKNILTWQNGNNFWEEACRKKEDWINILEFGDMESK